MAARAQEATLKPRHRVLIVILLDLLMPGVGGLGVLAAIRAASPNAATPVIICMMAGANAYPVKPIRRAELVSTVRAQLAARNKPKPPREDDG